MKGSFPPLFRAVALFGAAIYFVVFASVGIGVLRLGEVVWRADSLLYLEVVMWVVFFSVCLKLAFEEVTKIGQQKA